MEKTKLNLYDIWNEIGNTKEEAEKVNFLLGYIDVIEDYKTRMTLGIIYDYTDKTIKRLESIEFTLEKAVKNNG